MTINALLEEAKKADFWRFVSRLLEGTKRAASCPAGRKRLLRVHPEHAQVRIHRTCKDARRKLERVTAKYPARPAPTRAESAILATPRRLDTGSTKRLPRVYMARRTTRDIAVPRAVVVRYPMYRLVPPSTEMAVPVIHSLRGETRKTARSATSCTLPRNPSGIFATVISTIFS